MFAKFPAPVVRTAFGVHDRAERLVARAARAPIDGARKPSPEGNRRAVDAGDGGGA